MGAPLEPGGGGHREQLVLWKVEGLLRAVHLRSVRPDLETGCPWGEDNEEGQCAHVNQQLIEGLWEAISRTWGLPPGPPTEGVWELGLHHQPAQEDGVDPWSRESKGG